MELSLKNLGTEMPKRNDNVEANLSLSPTSQLSVGTLEIGALRGDLALRGIACLSFLSFPGFI